MRSFLWNTVLAIVFGVLGAAIFYHFNEAPTKAELIEAVYQDLGLHADGAIPSKVAEFESDKKGLVPPISKADYADLPSFVYASQKTTPSVVYIKTLSQTRYATSYLEWFFGGQAGQSISSGSGVIYSSDGYIMTNNHVINDANEIQVIINKKPYEASLVGTDPSTDLAVLKIDAGSLQAIEFASSRRLQVGDWVLAVGNPFNLTSTVTSGIVSAKGRELNIMKSNFPIESFIQTDAAINPGNSGGALVNLDGKLVGINTAILSKTGSYAGYGFAVPSDIVRKVVEDIIKYGEVQKAFFGGEVLDINERIANTLSLEEYEGVALSYVNEDGAAKKAGLNKGDVILRIDNIDIDSRSDFEEVLSYHWPGDKIKVEYRSQGKIKTTELILTNREGTTELIERNIFSSRAIGADLEKISKVERDLLNVEHGVRIVKISNGLVRQMRLTEGFTVVYINRIKIETPEQLAEILEKIRGRVTVEGVSKQGKWQSYRYYF